MPSITINYTVGEGTRFAAAVGKAKALMDNQVPPQPRAATVAECKQFVLERMKQLIIDIEGSEANKAAIAAVTLTPFEPT